MPLDVVDTLCQLVRIPSVNPMGRAMSGDACGEHAVTEFLQAVFSGLGVAWERQTVDAGRDNIVACLGGRGSAETASKIVVFEAHQDTVPVDGMTIDPWAPVIRDGRLYGRGSCDVKGGMACMLAAFSRLVEQPPPHMPTIVLACTVNEEHGFTGASELARGWSTGSSRLVPRPPDAVIVAEPTSLDVVVCHKGVVRWRCDALGRAAHSACPSQGDNAIYHMGHAVVAFEQYATELARRTPHARVGVPTISVGTIRGGICVNAVPDFCSIEIDRRLLPHEEPEQARAEAMQWLAAHVPQPDRFRHEQPFLVSPALPDQADTALARRLAETARAHGCRGHLVGVPFGTDAPAFSALGTPTVVFGPGSIEQAHTAAEWVPLDQLHAATEVFWSVAKDFDSLPGRERP